MYSNLFPSSTTYPTARARAFRFGNRPKVRLVAIFCKDLHRINVVSGLNWIDFDLDLLRIDVTIDGCDEADDALTLIKGGGGCQTQEKVWYHIIQALKLHYQWRYH